MISEEDRNTVLYEVSDQVATVTLNRPESLNAITDQLTSELYDVIQTAASDRKVRAIVLTGAGSAFCAGGDITGFGNQTPQELITKLPRQFDMNRRPDFQTRHTYFPAISKPIIGIINGATAGLGLLYALFCDVRFASEDAVSRRLHPPGHSGQPHGEERDRQEGKDPQPFDGEGRREETNNQKQQGHDPEHGHHQGSDRPHPAGVPRPGALEAAEKVSAFPR